MAGVEDQVRVSGQSVRRIADLLNALRDHREGLSVSEASRITGIHKSSTSRLLAALRSEKMVDYEDASRRYRLGSGIISMAASMEPSLFLKQAANPFLERLVEETGETATLSIRDEFEVLTIDEVSGPSAIRYVAWTGMRTPMHASASGKCLLAFSHGDLLDSYLESIDLQPRTSQTIITATALREEIERTRQQGFGEVDSELEDGLAALSAPVLDQSGRLLGAVNVTWPSFRVDRSDRDRFLKCLLSASRELSGVFGYRPQSLVCRA
jgi:DNA-binding IclR family transcriptional regulator